LVLIDLTMPRLGGSDAYREMRRARPDVRAILTSGFALEEATSGFEGKGLAGFVRKPFRADELLRAVFEAVGP
jgi:two-component system, cell cycle sensor histidine kinase and response regulator CckA